MTHYRLTLALGEGAAVQIVAEVHKDVPRCEQGWGRKMRASPFVSVRMRQCAFEDVQCKPFQAWLLSKEVHEDDVEAEDVRGEDAEPPYPSDPKEWKEAGA